MTTTFVMKKNTYSIIMNTILLANNERVKKIQRNLNKYKYKVNLEKLGVRKYFWFNKGFRDLLRLTQNQSILETQDKAMSLELGKKLTKLVSKDEDIYGLSNNLKPFEDTIEAIKAIPKIESPMMKLEYIY